jgi:hypothetical protein
MKSMKKIITFILALTILQVVSGQDYFSQQFVGSGGGQTDNATYHTSWSIGEAVTESGTAGSVLLTGGFQQGEMTGQLVWTGSISSDWNTAANWNLNLVPNETFNVTIPDGSIPNDPIVYEDPATPATCLNLDIQPERTLTIFDGDALTVNGNLVNNGGSYSLYIGDGASLLAEGTITGQATVDAGIAANEWHLISSPVNNAVSGLFTGDYLQEFTELTDAYSDIIPDNIPLNPMDGYALWGGTGGFEAVFAGTLNHGLVGTDDNCSRTNQGWNLVGNPYPSSIDWDAASGWTKTNLNNAIYIHVNSTTWATYVDGVGVNGGSQNIAPCQGFFVRASAPGNATLKMENDVRVHSSAPFFKDAVSDLVRLELSGNNVSDEVVVRILPSATIGFDGNHDAYKMFSAESYAPQIYSEGGDLLAINAIPEAKPVVVGVRTGLSGSYTISAKEINNFSELWLEDTRTKTITDLTQGSYKFSFVAGEVENRFVLHFSPVPPPSDNESEKQVYSYGNSVYVNIDTEEESDIFVFDILGRVIKHEQAVKGINRLDLSGEGIYLVRVSSPNHTVTEKVKID